MEDQARAPAVKRVTSPANPAVKAVRALHQKKHRERTGLFLAEGLRLLSEARALGHGLETLVILPEMRAHRVGRDLVAACLDGGGRVLEVDEAVLAKIARKDNPQGAVGVFRQRWEPLSGIDARGDVCWAVLESPRDPGNVGTILRTCDAVGAQGAILLDNACDPYSPEGVRASMGSIFAQRLAAASFTAFMDWRRHQGGVLAAATPTGEADYQDVRYSRPVFLLMGNEQSGLPAGHEAACDHRVRLPMRGRADSLNVAVAASVLLYEVLNQHRRRP